MTARILVDTNVVIYTLDPRDPTRQARCKAWVSRLSQANMLTISPQVLNEAHAIARGKLEIAASDLAVLLEPWLFWCEAPLTRDTTAYALRIEARWRTSWWDALLLAFAATNDCTHVLTEDEQGAPVIEGVRIVNPFKTEPAEIIGAI